MAFLTAQEAAVRLGVSRKTLYAYVSRGLLKAYVAENPRERQYAEAAVDRLAAERHRGRRPQEVAKATLDWGLPVLESGITLIRDGRIWYRGVDVIDLARTADLEDAAAILWPARRATAFGPEAPRTSMQADSAASAPATGLSRETLMARFASLTGEEDTAAWISDPALLAAGCGQLVRCLASCVTAVAPTVEPVHQQCARNWDLDASGADLVRAVLVLCADHELNTSGFAVRCTASTGASLRACVIGGLAALSGPLHGGTASRVEALWDMVETDGPDIAVRRRLMAGETLPGFGQLLYPNGDPRAAALLSRLPPAASPAASLVETVARSTGEKPTIHFALVAVCRFLGLPRGSAFGLFALGRSVGWIAHALEQRANGSPIRPRAVYVGPLPDTSTPHKK
ncbi:excisionase [Bradyrhizobium sp. NAS80.1]|uniref:citrate synthase family protein n=1 Tax=Bradyrhizobium sp. NAS80.1 TaxID=1680159 RepID=UPI0009612B37|nr:citrate synthase family protein [Bradyrhizobium sp. NAS80.1]OKO70235.1 excisionase [Bradyrhizobium sp. NAS80.1]